MKEMLQEFIERDFTAREMYEILRDIATVEDNYKLIKLYRNNGSLDMVYYVKRDLRDDLEELQSNLESVGLEYSTDDLVDDGGVEL